MITTYILGAVSLVVLWYWQSLVHIRLRSAVFVVNDGNERWVVDFTTKTLYYRYFYKVPHPTDRDLNQDYEIRSRRTGSGIHITPPLIWEMRLTGKSWARAKQEALAILENPKGSFRSVRRRAKKASVALGSEPTWEPVPFWLIRILNSRYEVFLKYQVAQEVTYQNHPGRVENLERYLTQGEGFSCSNGSKGGSLPKRFLKIYGSASSTAGRPAALKKRDSHAVIG
jgi:hypothetical protein